MYVIKKDELGFKRGQKVFEKPPVAYRDIYFYPEETRKALKELLPIFDIPAQNQIGFTKGKGIQDLYYHNPSRTDLTRIKLDLKDAFNSVTQKHIFWLLRIVFDLNTKLSKELSHLWTTKGHMLQGHPLAPAIFNLVTRDLNCWLSVRTGIVQYADDILIYEKSDYISWHWIKIIFSKFNKLGFRINVEKEGIYHKRKDLEFLGLKYTFNDTKPLISSKRRKRRKLIRKLRRLLKDNNPILLGNINWINYDVNKIVFNKIQSQNTSKFTYQSGAQDPKIGSKRHKKGDSKKNLWYLWTNPAAIPIG